MKPNGSFATTTSAGILLAFMFAAEAAHTLPCLACQVATSYHAAVRVYDRARAWGVIARWWIDPEYICQARPADGQAR